MSIKPNSKIAIVGSGISGLGIASLLNDQHDIRLYEANDYLGGHSRTIDVETSDGRVAVDTGFIVFNHKTYPLLTAMFEHFGVETAKSEMSFGASVNNGWLEYSTDNVFSFFAQRRNFTRVQFIRMLIDIVRFNFLAPRYLTGKGELSLGQCLDELGMSEWFRRYFLLAMGGAIWSTPVEQMLEFPASSFIRFFENHGLLTVANQPQWHTVKGGSREYVQKISAPFQDKVRLSTAVKEVVRSGDKVLVIDNNGGAELFDQVVFASHADTTLSLINNPTESERNILGNFSYLPNTAYLHSDTSFMPQRRGAWASWVYRSDQEEDKNPVVSLSYWMNNLQPLETEQPIIATLNPSREPDPELTHDVHTFQHPMFDSAAMEAQSRISDIQGADRLWFCGAYQFYGFHEDGLRSASRLGELMGAKVPWQ